MNRRPAYYILICCLLLHFEAHARLLPCPECTNSVSTLARFCPRCGCVIEEILKADSLRAQQAEASAHAWKGSAVLLRSNRETWPGMVADFPDGRFVISPLAPLEAVESLDIVTLVDTNTVAYASLEIADTADLARLATPATNVTALAFAAGTTTNQTWRHGEMWVGQSTNLLRVSGCRGLAVGESLPASQIMTTRWLPVKPLAFREQTRLLRAATAARTREEQMLKQLESTPWLSTFLREEALRQRKRIDTLKPLPSEILP